MAPGCHSNVAQMDPGCHSNGEGKYLLQKQKDLIVYVYVKCEIRQKKVHTKYSSKQTFFLSYFSGGTLHHLGCVLYCSVTSNHKVSSTRWEIGYILSYTGNCI